MCRLSISQPEECTISAALAHTEDPRSARLTVVCHKCYEDHVVGEEWAGSCIDCTGCDAQVKVPPLPWPTLVSVPTGPDAAVDIGPIAQETGIGDAEDDDDLVVLSVVGETRLWNVPGSVGRRFPWKPLAATLFLVAGGMGWWSLTPSQSPPETTPQPVAVDETHTIDTLGFAALQRFVGTASENDGLRWADFRLAYSFGETSARQRLEAWRPETINVLAPMDAAAYVGGLILRGEKSNAIGLGNTLLGQAPYNTSPHVHFAMAAAYGQGPAANRHAARALDRAPRMGDARLLVSNHPDEVIDWAIKTPHPHQFLALVNQFIERGESQKIVRLLNDSSADEDMASPTHKSRLKQLHLRRQLLGLRFAEVAQTLQHRNDFVSMLQAATFSAAAGHRADDYLKRAESLARNPDERAEVVVTRVRIALQQKRLAEAKTAVRKLRGGTQKPWRLFAAALIARARGNDKQARRKLQTAAGMAPDNHQIVAAAMASSGRDAIGKLSAASAAQPNGYYDSQLARQLAMAGRFDEAAALREAQLWNGPLPHDPVAAIREWLLWMYQGSDASRAQSLWGEIAGSAPSTLADAMLAAGLPTPQP